MTKPVSDIAFTKSVKAVQERLGSRKGYASMEARGGWSDAISPELHGFLAQRDSVYLGTATADGRPYIQHRGGLPGFVKVLDDHTLAFADYSGNRQYISVGNLTENDQAFLFLMDYETQSRIKIWGRAKFVEDDPALLERVFDAGYRARPERVLVFTVEAWDVNCPQHITPRYTEAEIEPIVQRLQARISDLESQLQAAQTV